MRIEKSIGVNDSEKLLVNLAEKTFLKLWSFPNPIKSDKKELCDLIAIFSNHIFIFFDRKRILDDDSENLEKNWTR